MKIRKPLLLLAATLLALTGCKTPLYLMMTNSEAVVYQPNIQNASSMTFRQAQQQLFTSLEKSEGFTGEHGGKVLQEIKITPTNFQLKRLPGIGDGSIPMFKYRDMDITNLAVIFSGVYCEINFPL